MVDLDGADKASGFIRFGDAFNIPMINLIDCPGYVGGKEQEDRGIIHHVANMVYAYGEATVLRIAIAVRKVYGAGISGMGMSKAFGTDLTLAYPFAEIAAMALEAAMSVLFEEEIAKSSKPKEVRMMRTQEYRENFANPYWAAERGWIDMVFDPKETRIIVFKALDRLKTKTRGYSKKSHGTIPL